MMGVSQLAVSTMLGDSRQQQQTGSLGWRIGVALTTKPGKTLMFTKECHNIDKLKQQGVTESLAIVTPEGVGGGTTKGIRQTNREDSGGMYTSLTVHVTS